MTRPGFDMRPLTAGLRETLSDFRGLWRPAAMPAADDDAARMARVVASRQFRSVMRQSPANLAGTSFALVLWILAFWAMGASSFSAWSLMGLACVAYVTLVYLGFQRRRPADGDLAPWETRIKFGILLSGLVWAAAILVPAPQAARPYVAAGTMLMLVGGLSLFATFRPGISLYTTSSQIITCGKLLTTGDPLDAVTGLGFAVALGLMVRQARAYNTSLTRAMLVAEERKLLLEELALQRREAERASLAKTFLLASVSHDLRQPLSTISLLVEAERQGGTVDPHVIEQLSASVHAMDDLVGALLDVSRLDSGAEPLQISTFAVVGLLERLRMQFAPQARAKGLRLEVESSELRITSDFFQLERVVANLVANAIRYTPDGGVRVRTKLRKTTLWLQVWDSGIGIARKDRSRVFDEFFQVTRTTRSGRQGLGLGLTIVQRTAHRLNHLVRVRSRPGRGTVFEIGLPIAVTESEQSGGASLAPLLDGRLVLLIDDDPMVLKNMAALLTGFNCQVLTAGSLTDALRAVDQCLRLPDLIITDFHLGRDGTGLEAVNRVRALTEEDIPAVLVTTHPAAASNKEQVPVLAKPLRPQALAKALQGLPRY